MAAACQLVAGLAAAITARDHSASVIAVEENYDIGGRGILSGGRLHLGGGNALQKKFGIKDSPDQVYSDWINSARGDSRYNDRDLVRIFADESLPTFDHSYAEMAAPPAPAAPAPGPEPPTPPCDAKMTISCSPNSGDTAWMLTSVALVLMMTIPGLGLFYGGMVRKKNVGDTVMTSFAITCLITILWVICTYSLAFTPG